MSKPVGPTEGSSASNPLFLDPLPTPNEKKIVYAFDVNCYGKKPKGDVSCQWCKQVVYLAPLYDATCNKCRKVFCRVHYSPERHDCGNKLGLRL
jgi:predicted nucleic acid binding AN1-type Zn finger protein